MCDHERSTRFHSAAHLLQRAEPLLWAQKVEGEETGRRSHGPSGALTISPSCSDNCAASGPSISSASFNIAAAGPPFPLSFGDDLEFHATAGPEDEHPRILRRALGEQQQSHPMQSLEDPGGDKRRQPH